MKNNDKRKTSIHLSSKISASLNDLEEAEDYFENKEYETKMQLSNYIDKMKDARKNLRQLDSEYASRILLKKNLTFNPLFSSVRSFVRDYCNSPEIRQKYIDLEQNKKFYYNLQNFHNPQDNQQSNFSLEDSEVKKEEQKSMNFSKFLKMKIQSNFPKIQKVRFNNFNQLKEKNVKIHHNTPFFENTIQKKMNSLSSNKSDKIIQEDKSNL